MTEREKQKTYWVVALAIAQLGLREEQKELQGKEATTLVGARGGLCNDAASRKGDCGNSPGWVKREQRGGGGERKGECEFLK